MSKRTHLKKLILKIQKHHHNRQHPKGHRHAKHMPIDWIVEPQTHIPYSKDETIFKDDTVSDEWLRKYKERNKILGEAFY